MTPWRLLFVFALVCVLSGVVLAADATLNQANTAWILTSTALVLFMTLPGLALFYGGLVRSKNLLSVLMQCFAIAAMASIVWLIFGYSLAFGDGNAWIGDFSKAMLSGVTRESLSGDIPEPLFMLFQMTFAIITPALVVGGFADSINSMAGQVWVQLIGIFSVLVFTAVVTWGILKIVAALTGLRVGEEEEVEGLDIALHEERGYDIH